MYLKPKLFILLFGLLTISSFSQTTLNNDSSFVYKNSIQTELGGNGIIYSFNYERVILNGSKFKTAAQIGFALFPPPWESDYLIPLIINEIISFNKHHIEIGFGTAIIKEERPEYTNNPNVYFYLTGRLGYRYQKPGGRFITRIGFTPLLDILYGSENRDILPWGGISFGYNFGKR